jgi:hypothetical protein
MSNSVVLDRRQISQSNIGMAAIGPYPQESAQETAHPDQSSPLEGVNIVSVEDIPPDGGYGWVCTACVFLINAHTWVCNSCKHVVAGVF